MSLTFARRLLLLTFCLASACLASNDQPRHHPAHSGDLVSSLEFISVNYRIPMIVELPQDYPPSVNIPNGRDSVRELLNRVLAPFPNITCEWRDGVVLVLDSRLRNAKHNFFNIELSSFRMPADVAELRLDLNNAMDAEHGSVPSVRTGILTPSLQKLKLQDGEILRRVTGRDVLVRAAQETSDLFSVAVFKSWDPKSKQDIEAARISWTIRSIDELSENPTRMRSIAPAKS